MKPVLRSSFFAFSLLASALTLAACGGGGGGASTTPAISTGGGGSGTGTGSGSGGPAQTASVAISLTLQQYAPVVTSSSTRKAAFISPATAQISLKLNSVNGVAQTGTAQTFAVGPNATSCTSVNGVVTCALNATLPVGTDVITASTLDASNTVLGSSQIQATVVQNATNRIPLAVGGTIAKVQLYLSNHSFVTGTAATANLFVVPFDSSGAAIVNPGNYSPAIAVSLSQSLPNRFSLITNGGTAASTATINSPNDQVVLKYDGTGTAGSTSILASAGTGITDTTSAGYSTNIPGLSINPSGPQLVNAFTSYIFTAPSQTGNIAVSGGQPPYTIATTNSSVVTTGGTSPNFTITSVAYGTTGSATITITDSGTPNPATVSIPVTFIAPAITLLTTNCGSSCAPDNASATWIVPLGGPVVPLSPTTFTASGGNGIYTYLFTSTNSTSSSSVHMSQSGNAFTVTPNGFGNDAVIIVSGNQTAYYGINASANAFGQALPAAIGFLVEGVGKSYSATVPSAVLAATQSGGPALGLGYSSTGPTITASPTGNGHGNIIFSNSTSSTTVPFTTFALTFSTYAGTGYGQTSQTFNAPGADEALLGIGVADTVTVAGAVGVLQATSSNPAVVTTSVSGNTVTVTSVGAGFASITLKDAGTFGTQATATYPVSVTSTTIPIASHARLP